MTTAATENTRPADHIDKVVAALPPLTPEQVGRLMPYFPPKTTASETHQPQSQRSA